MAVFEHTRTIPGAEARNLHQIVAADPTYAPTFEGIRYEDGTGEAIFEFSAAVVDVVALDAVIDTHTTLPPVVPNTKTDFGDVDRSQWFKREQRTDEISRTGNDSFGSGTTVAFRFDSIQLPVASNWYAVFDYEWAGTDKGKAVEHRIRRLDDNTDLLPAIAAEPSETRDNDGYTDATRVTPEFTIAANTTLTLELGHRTTDDGKIVYTRRPLIRWYRIS